VKISISLPDQVHALAERAVAAGRAPSLSALVAEAITLCYDPNGLRTLLDQLDAEFGPVSEEVKREVDAEFETLLGAGPTMAPDAAA
jgi:Arc/MetJ-type ribon-helix-helix transcriptional regulator